MNWVLGIRTAALTKFFLIFPFFASEIFYIVLISLGFWCWNKKIFKNFAILVCISTLLNCGLKAIFRIPRPSIEHLVTVYDPFSFPSGDVQVVATFWFALAWQFRKSFLWWVASILTILVSLSRVYLGMHYPIDTLAGATTGFLLVAIFYKFKDLNLFKNNYLLYFISLFIYLLGMKNELNIMIITSSGLLFGIILGSMCENKFGIYAIPKEYKDKIITGCIGLASLFALRAGLMHLWKLDPKISYELLIYMLLGIHIIFFVPWICAHLLSLRKEQ